MPIYTEDLDLLKSAVMADVPEGGGAMTGVAVVDGQSNNIFPDSSRVDRTTGRAQVRKLFGVAKTSDTDTLTGAHAIITQPPADPLVHCALFKTTGWADTRTTAQGVIERYLVKGPRLTSRLMDTHYAGSLQLRLIAFQGSDFPASGEAIVLRNPDGAEQYLRIIKITTASQDIAVSEGSGTVVLTATVATCEIGQALAQDFYGPPLARIVNETSYAQIYTTTVAAGAQFCGIKALGAAGAPGDYSMTTEGGIFTPIVPAATIESPIIDQYPLTVRQSLSRTAQAAISLPPVTVVLQAGARLTLPTACEPGSLSITHGGTAFTDDGRGNLKQGGLVVGAVDYRSKTVTLLAGSPNYGSSNAAIVYRPATLAGAATHSDSLTMTLAKQGRAYTYAFEPPPAPGTFGLSYMAQGRCYELLDNGNGKLAGADTSYGVGDINYLTGSIGVTLGAIPDVGSDLIFEWGNASSAVAVASGSLPARMTGVLDLDSRAKIDTLTLAWSRGATTYSAACSAAGIISGDATGSIGDYDYTTGKLPLHFQPAVMPDGDVTVHSERIATTSSAVTNHGDGGYTLSQVPVTPGSVHFCLDVIPEDGFLLPVRINVVDNGAGNLISTDWQSSGAVVGRSTMRQAQCCWGAAWRQASMSVSSRATPPRSPAIRCITTH